MKEDILNKSVSDIRLRSLQKCINKTDSLIFNRDNSIVHIKKTNSINPFNNTNLGVNFSCNKYGNLETYADNSGTSVAVSANDIKGSNKEIKKACNNIYDEIFVDKRMHTTDRRGVRFGSVDCVNINSNNIYSNTRKNVTFNTKIYDDQDYFYNSIDSVIDDSAVNLKKIDTNTDSCFIFKNKDSITDYLYNKNKDHFFINTSIIVTDQNGSSSIIRKCNLFKLTKTDSGSTTSFQLFEPNKQFTFGYGPDAKQLASHNVYNVYGNIFNISCTNPARNETHVDTEPDYWGTNWPQDVPYDRWEWHSQHAKIINIDTVYTNEIVHGFNNINLMSFIMKYINRLHENDIEKKSFFGIYLDKKIANARDVQNYIKANNNTITSSVLTKKISFAENRYSQCGSHLYSPSETGTGGSATMGGTHTYTYYPTINRYKSRTRDTYNCIFPFGFALSNTIKKSNIENLSKNEIETIDNNVVSVIKKFNALNFLTIDKENLSNTIEFTDTLDINDATIDNHTYKIESSINVI